MGCACGIACVDPSPSIKNRPVSPARFEIPGPRDKGLILVTRQSTTGRCQNVNMILVINIPRRPPTASSLVGKRAVPVGCQQRLHRSDDRLPNTIRQTIKNSPRIGQTSVRRNNAYFPISTFSQALGAWSIRAREQLGCEPKINRALVKAGQAMSDAVLPKVLSTG
jgi:hypothetical protein